jgi:transcription termination/antitermination protein NusG
LLLEQSTIVDATLPAELQAVVAAPWYALWTHSHCEERVREQLDGKGFRTFLPMVQDWSRRAGVRRLIPKPMFPSYLFVQHHIDKRSYVEIMKAQGLVRILGDRWDRLETIPGAEVDAIRQLVNSPLHLMPHPYLQQGQRVRIVFGPLAGIQGILVRSRPERGLLVLTVDLLRRSVAVEVDCTAVEPAEAAPSSAGRLGARR